MHRNNFERSPPLAGYERRRSPINISPLNRPKPSKQNSSLTPPLNSNITETMTPNQNILKNIQQPLQFSAGRKLKYKIPQNNPSNVTPFINSSVYTYNTNNVLYQTSKLNNENSNYQQGINVKNQHYQINNLRSNYQLEMKALLDGQKSMQGQYQNKIKNIEKEKNYWRDNYNIIKQQFQGFIKNAEQKQREKDKQRERQRERQKQKSVSKEKHTFQQYGLKLPPRNNQIPTMPTNKPNIDQSIKLMQDQVQKYANSLKVAQDQIYNLHKLRAQLNYQITFYREENKKANNKLFQLQYQVQNQKRQVKELKQKVRNFEQSALRQKQRKANEQLSFSLDSKQREREQFCQASPQRYHQRSHSSSRNSTESLRSSMSSPRQKINGPSTRHHRSHSSQSHSQSHKSRHNPNNQSIEQIPFQLNFDQSKQIERLKHSYRKVQKSLHNQNSQIMAQGLKKLNQKYQKYEQEQKAPDILTKQSFVREIRVSSDINRVNDSNIYRYNLSTDSKIVGKPTIVKYI